MKRLRASGLGVKKRQAEPITIEEENALWEKGVLGESDPKALLDTILFLCGIHFSLRSGQEHRSLKLSQFEVQTKMDLLFYSTPKTHPKTTREGFLIAKSSPKV